jgi:hypothetical protein
MRLICSLLLLLLALAAPAAAQEEDLSGFDPIASFTAAGEQRGTKVRGVVDVRAQGADVVARVVRDGRLLGRLTFDGVEPGPLKVAVPLFASARKLLEKRGTLKVRLVVAVDPPADPPRRASRRVHLRR